MKKVILFLGVLFMSANVYAVEGKGVVTQANHAWNDAFNAGNIEQLAKLYAEQATLSPGNGAVLKGRDEIKALFSSFIENGVHNHQIETVELMTSDNQITQLGYWKAEGVDAENNAIAFGGVLMTVLVKNSAGEWQLQSHIWNMAP